MHTVIAETTKGHRVWIQGIYARSGRTEGQRYDVNYTDGAIHVIWSSTGKRKVTNSKGGIIDLVGKRITQWAHGATKCNITFTQAQIVIQRVA